MKTIALPLLMFGFAVVCSGAAQFRPAPGFADANGSATEPETPIPLAPPPKALSDFAASVEAALESRDFTQIEHLYQTNGVSAADLKRELTRWQMFLDEGGSLKVSLSFKEIATLPTARKVWGDYARNLTTHRATHLAFLRKGAAAGLALPLIEIEDRLLILPSDKVLRGSNIEPIGPAKRSQPIGSEVAAKSSPLGIHKPPRIAEGTSMNGVGAMLTQKEHVAIVGIVEESPADKAPGPDC